MGSEERVVCPENVALVEYMQKWWTEIAENKPKNYTQNTENNIKKAFTNVCKHKTPITTLKEFKEVKGVGKWFITQMREFFNCNSGPSQDDDLEKGGKKAKGSKNYLPQKNSVAYALLITLHRETSNGTEYMDKKGLIAAAEASGLSRVPIAPERGRGKPGASGSSGREWYSGWNAMKTLINKSLVYKSSCPAKYMLSDKGRQVALECLSRSGMIDSAQYMVTSKVRSDEQDAESLELVSVDVSTSSDSSTKKGTEGDIPVEFLERFTTLGYTREQVRHALAEVSPYSPSQDLSKLWPTVLCRLREIEVYDCHSNPQATVRRNSCGASTSCRNAQGEQNLTRVGVNQNGVTSCKSTASSATSVSPVISSASLDYQVKGANKSIHQDSNNALRLPPLEDWEKFEDAYKVVLILDDREHFIRWAAHPFLYGMTSIMSKYKIFLSKSSLTERIRAEFKIEIENDRLPVGDAIWVARHKQLCTDYVLDFIVERKNIDDLRSSIKDNRYKDQKLRLQRAGMKKIMYVVEGDTNACEAADSIKTACFTTEILDGFDVQRTNGLADTLRRYGFLTQAITDHYKMSSWPDKCKSAGTCPSYAEFKKNCQDLEKMTVSDVFATQLMQVSHVTEKVAKAVLDCYPTLHSLALAYAALDGDTAAQEKLLMNKSEGAVSAVASKNIFRLVWG
ncbi:Crossover junction endonuclease MUS81 [Bienertia sinuspersici]